MNSVIVPAPALAISEGPIVRAKGVLRPPVADRYHYIRSKDGSEELYDIVNDPFEKNDLSRSEKEREILSQFRTTLETIH